MLEGAIFVGIFGWEGGGAGAICETSRYNVFSMSRNVVVSFADVIATIWNIVYDQNTSKKSVKLHKQNNI